VGVAISGQRRVEGAATAVTLSGAPCPCRPCCPPALHTHRPLAAPPSLAWPAGHWPLSPPPPPRRLRPPPPPPHTHTPTHSHPHRTRLQVTVSLGWKKSRTEMAAWACAARELMLSACSSASMPFRSGSTQRASCRQDNKRGGVWSREEDMVWGRWGSAAWAGSLQESEAGPGSVRRVAPWQLRRG
jgi:hypothetical protein